MWLVPLASRRTRIRKASPVRPRLSMAADSTWKMKAIVVVGNLLAIVFFLLAGLVIHRETGRRNLAEQDASDPEMTTESIIRSLTLPAAASRSPAAESIFE